MSFSFVICGVGVVITPSCEVVRTKGDDSRKELGWWLIQTRSSKMKAVIMITNLIVTPAGCELERPLGR